MNHLDTQELIKRNFAKIEEKFPVDKWVVEGIHVWPYIRIKLYFDMLTSANTKKKNQNFSNDNSIIGLRQAKIIFKLIYAFFSVEFFFFKINRKKVLFFGSHIHRVLQDSKYFNRFYDSIVEHHSLHNDVYMVEYQKINKNTYNQKAVIPLVRLLKNYKLLYKLKSKTKKKKQVSYLEAYDEFCALLLDLDINPKSIGVTTLDLLQWSKKINALEKFYLRFFRKTKPSKIIFLGYYGYDDLYAAILVANTLKIKTIDFQHGPQTNVHMAYSNWLKVPADGFNIMTKEFWNWDKNSKNNIDAWANKIDSISTKLIGQPYIAYWMNRQTHINNADDEKMILYSMQTSPLELFTPKLISLIKKSSYKWIIRLHPRNNISLESIKHFMEKNGIVNNVILQDSIDEPLPLVLNKSILHITNYSGCTIEAKMMGVPTVLIHKVGMEMFKIYIDDMFVYYLNQNRADFELKFQDIVKHVEQESFKSNYSEILNPLTLN